mgnify:CR=1 FL=1
MFLYLSICDFYFVALNDKEILGQAIIFLIAGYETTSVLMSFFFYTMATESSIQEKVYEEIRQVFGDVCVEIKFKRIVIVTVSL